MHPGALRKNFRREIAAELLEVARALVEAERKHVAESGAARTGAQLASARATDGRPVVAQARDGATLRPGLP